MHRNGNTAGGKESTKESSKQSETRKDTSEQTVGKDDLSEKDTNAQKNEDGQSDTASDNQKKKEDTTSDVRKNKSHMGINHQKHQKDANELPIIPVK